VHFSRITEASVSPLYFVVISAFGTVSQKAELEIVIQPLRHQSTGHPPSIQAQRPDNGLFPISQGKSLSL
jgi:hypothetical protein